MNEQRKTQRFALKLPIELLKTGADDLPRIGELRNLSSGGVLFTADAALQRGQAIEYLVTLPSQGQQHELRLRCIGKVVRVDERPTPDSNAEGFPYTIAVTLERHEFLRH